MNNRWIRSRLLWGGMLIVAGVLFLLQNLGVIQFANLIWSILLAIIGVFVLSFFLADRNNWWALIPAIVLFDLALFIALSTLIPHFADTIGGALFLGGIGVSFWLVYLLRRDYWWAIIPGGALLTLAVVVIVASLGYALETAGIFFFGLGVTFTLVALAPTPEGRLTWAWIPAGILAGLGLIVISATTNLILYVFPAILIVVGLYLIIRTIRLKEA